MCMSRVRVLLRLSIPANSVDLAFLYKSPFLIGGDSQHDTQTPQKEHMLSVKKKACDKRVCVESPLQALSRARCRTIAAAQQHHDEGMKEIKQNGEECWYCSATSTGTCFFFFFFLWG